MERERLPAAARAYEPPRLVVLGTLLELTQHGGKGHGGSDGHAFQQHPLVHSSR